MFSTNSCTFNTDAQPKDNTKKKKRMKQLRKVKHQLSDGKNSEHILHLASFPDLPIILFLIACSMRKWRGKAWSILSCECCFVSYLGRQKGEASLIEITDRGLLPPSVYLGRQNIHMIKWPSSSSALAYSKQPKTQQWEGLRMKLYFINFYTPIDST